jgi:hypothetical protein
VTDWTGDVFHPPTSGPAANDEQVGASSSLNQNGSGLALGELQAPSRCRPNVVKHPLHASPVRGADVVRGNEPVLTLGAERGDPDRPVEDMNSG